MQPVQYKLSLDVSRPGSQGMLHVKEGDTRSREMAVSLYCGKEVFELGEDMLAVMRAIKPDGTIVYNDCTIEKSVVRHIMTQQLLAAAGVVRCEVTIYGAGGELLYSPFFEIAIEKNLYEDSLVESTDEFSALTQAMTAIRSLENEMETAEAGREDAENTRISAESTRISAENDRVGLYGQIKEDYESGALIGPPGPGVAAGGTAGQILMKASSADYDTEWKGVTQLMGLIYPVGSIYMSVRNVNPSALFGGTWTAWGAGRVAVGVDTAQTEFNTTEKTGGAKSVKLTAGQLPVLSGTWGSMNYTGSPTPTGIVTKTGGANDRTFPATGTNWGQASFKINIGNGETHENMPPYITCYMWKRTA
ncbi:MAG: phage baseplate protein [Christensenellaceae bacterium]|jgi:hypothetical protein